MTYCIYKIKDFCQVGDGAHASIKREDVGIMYLTTKNFKSKGLDLSTLDYISRSSYEKHFKASKSAITTPCANDVLLGIIGSIGMPYLVKEGETFGISSSVAILRPQQGLDAKFLFYFMRSSIFQQSVDAIKSGAAQGFLSLEMIRNLPLIAPEEAVQQQIAEILSAYDDLIETNNQRIATLEQLAQQIYKEWFVRMRFPGWENTQFHHGIPDGWEQILFGEIAKEVKRHIKLKDLKPDSIYVGLEHLPVKSIALQNWDTAESISSDKLLFNKNDILFCKIRPYLHKVALAPFNGSCSSDTIVIKATDERILPYTLQIAFCDAFIDYATATSKGTKMPRADWGVLKKFPIFRPNRQLIEKFNETSLPILEQINSLSEMNRLLTKTRNLLLPRLISGKLGIKQAEALTH